MFPRKLTSAAELSLKTMGQTSYEYEISDSGYGKDHVKILHVRRDGAVHHIKEFEVNTHLKLYSKKDYMHGKWPLTKRCAGKSFSFAFILIFFHLQLLSIIILGVGCRNVGIVNVGIQSAND